MGPHMGGQPRDDGLTAADTATWARLNGVFWAAFLLFSWTTASVLSGAVIERIRSGAFWVLAVLVGSVTWVQDLTTSRSDGALPRVDSVLRCRGHVRASAAASTNESSRFACSIKIGWSHVSHSVSRTDW